MASEDEELLRGAGALFTQNLERLMKEAVTVLSPFGFSNPTVEFHRRDNGDMDGAKLAVSNGLIAIEFCSEMGECFVRSWYLRGWMEHGLINAYAPLGEPSDGTPKSASTQRMGCFPRHLPAFISKRAAEIVETSRDLLEGDFSRVRDLQTQHYRADIEEDLRRGIEPTFSVEILRAVGYTPNAQKPPEKKRTVWQKLLGGTKRRAR